MAISKTYVEAYQAVMAQVQAQADRERALAVGKTQARYNAWDAIAEFCANEHDAIQNAWAKEEMEKLNDEELLVLWDNETKKAEESDNWDRVADIESEVTRRGLRG